MNDPKNKLNILLSFGIIIILITYFFFFLKKSTITEIDKNLGPSDKLQTILNIPKTAFWIEKNDKGNWFNIDKMHNHKNNVHISIYNQFGELITKGHFLKVCSSNNPKFIENIKAEIDFYDGKNIQLKDSCYLLKRK